MEKQAEGVQVFERGEFTMSSLSWTIWPWPHLDVQCGQAGDSSPTGIMFSSWTGLFSCLLRGQSGEDVISAQDVTNS